MTGPERSGGAGHQQAQPDGQADAGGLTAAARPDGDGLAAYTEALRRELDDTNRGLLALHAELSHHQRQLEHARDRAEAAGRAKAALLATMSHELRSPMTAVVGFAGLLMETELTAEQREYVRAVHAAGDHLLGVIDSVLNLSRIESGHLELEDIPFDLYNCVEDAVGMLALRAAEKDLALAALFAPRTPATVRGDPLRLGQILVNLLTNAVKFTSHGQIALHVDHRPDAGQLVFRVTDTGAGIPPDALNRLFSPYSQADPSTARSHGGTGLGLSICRQLATHMGGTITVESTVGRGSTFTCTIRTRPDQAAATNDDQFLAGTHILVVHRHDLVAEAVRRHLVSWGARVITGPAVEDSDRWPRIDLALVDAGDPDTYAGHLAHLAGLRRDPPTIALTTPAGRHRPAGHTVIAVPVRRSHLRQTVLTALGGTPPVEPEPSRVAAPTEPRTMLYVDDDPMMVTLVTRVFSREPAVTLFTAQDGTTALGLATRHRPDVIMLDLNLADTSGDAILGKLRGDARTGSIPVVIVSGDARPETIARLTGLGAAGYLTKPFELADLRQLIHRYAR